MIDAVRTRGPRSELRRRLRCAVLPLAAVTIVACASAKDAASPQKTAKAVTAAANDPGAGIPIVSVPEQEGLQHLKFKWGPVKIQPGQNNISYSGMEIPKPAVDGFIVGIHPNLVRDDGSVPPVDVIHLHHGVWVNVGRGGDLFFASGEEKTQMILPKGYGYPYKASEPWLIMKA